VQRGPRRIARGRRPETKVERITPQQQESEFAYLSFTSSATGFKPTHLLEAHMTRRARYRGAIIGPPSVAIRFSPNSSVVCDDGCDQ
jgi:hypothetical protein